MLSTLDMLYIVLAFCAIWVTVFMCWFLFNIVKVVRSFSEALEATREQIRHVEHAIHGVRVKFEDGATAMKVIAEMARRWITRFGKGE